MYSCFSSSRRRSGTERQHEEFRNDLASFADSHHAMLIRPTPLQDRHLQALSLLEANHRLAHHLLVELSVAETYMSSSRQTKRWKVLQLMLIKLLRGTQRCRLEITMWDSLWKARKRRNTARKMHLAGTLRLGHQSIALEPPLRLRGPVSLPTAADRSLRPLLMLRAQPRV